MSNQDTRSKRHDQIQREKKLRRKLNNHGYNHKKVSSESYERKSSIDLKNKITEALDNLEV